MGHDGGVADQLPPSTFVVVSGPPASGKTTLARAIAPALGLPLIARDAIKEALMTVLPVPDIEASRTIGAASVAALLAWLPRPAEPSWRASGAAVAPEPSLAASPDTSSRCSAGAILSSRRSATHCARAHAPRGTLTPSGRSRSCGTGKWASRWLEAGR